MTVNGSKKRIQQFLNADVFLIPDYFALTFLCKDSIYLNFLYNEDL